MEQRGKHFSLHPWKGNGNYACYPFPHPAIWHLDLME
jgi:hypothetical protein